MHGSSHEKHERFFEKIRKNVKNLPYLYRRNRTCLKKERIANMDTLFMDYENSLIGANKDIGIYNFYGAESGGANQQRAVTCIRYVLENVLQWTVEEAIQKFDNYMITLMKLERVVDFIRYPDEVRNRDPRYILSLVYPERVHLNLETMVLDIYKDVLAHEAQFPREYFAGANGFYRYCICLQYLITHYHPITSLEELYNFITSPEGKRFLMEYRLKVPAEQLEINPLDCLYELTKENEFSTLYYCFYMFNEQIQKIA